jgi:predicted ATPase
VERARGRPLKVLEFTTPVMFFVGENGSGKSTVLEGIAAGMRAVCCRECGP